MILVTVLLFLLMLNRNRCVRAEKKTLEVSLETKNKEWATNVMYLMKNAGLVKDMITHLVTLSVSVKFENVRVIKDMIFVVLLFIGLLLLGELVSGLKSRYPWQNELLESIDHVEEFQDCSLQPVLPVLYVATDLCTEGIIRQCRFVLFYCAATL